MSLDFGGGSGAERVDCGTPDVPANTPTLSIMAWVFAREVNAGRRAFSKAQGTGAPQHVWMLGSNSNLLRSRIQAGGSTTTVQAGNMAAQLNVWTHIACVYDGTNQTNYINGVAVGSGANSGDVEIDSGMQYWIGAQPPNNPNNTTWDGLVADVRIYTRALSVAELQHIHLSFGGDGITTGIFLWHRCTERSAGTPATASTIVPNIAPGTPGTSRFDGIPSVDTGFPAYANDVVRWRGAYNH